MSFQEQLQTLRKAKGLSQEKLAEFLGISYRGPIIYQNGQYKYHCIIKIRSNIMILNRNELCWCKSGLNFHFGKRGTGMVLAPGMVFTIEPMINAGSHEIFIDENNGWTALTADGSLSAQWEHTVLVTENGIEIISR